MQPVLDKVGRGLCLGSSEGSTNRVDDCMMMDERWLHIPRFACGLATAGFVYRPRSLLQCLQKALTCSIENWSSYRGSSPSS